MAQDQGVRGLFFYELHIAIQDAFGWENRHMFQFSHKGIYDRVCYGIPAEEDIPERVTLDAQKVLINEVFAQAGQSYCYIYDFGDLWEHSMILDKIEDRNEKIPCCMDGDGACPPEDTGGIRGYSRMLEILKSDHQEKTAYRQWLGLADHEQWNAGLFNMEEASNRLCLLE